MDTGPGRGLLGAVTSEVLADPTQCHAGPLGMWAMGW